MKTIFSKIEKQDWKWFQSFLTALWVQQSLFFSPFFWKNKTKRIILKKIKSLNFSKMLIFLTYRGSETVMIVFYKKKLSKWNPALKARWKIQNRQGFILASINFRLAKRDREFLSKVNGRNIRCFPICLKLEMRNIWKIKKTTRVVWVVLFYYFVSQIHSIRKKILLLMKGACSIIRLDVVSNNLKLNAGL